MFEEISVRSNNITSGQELPSNPASFARGRRGLTDEFRGVVQQLRALPAQPDLEDAWCNFAALTIRIKQEDAHRLGELEQALEDRAEYPEPPPAHLRIPPVLLLETVGEELRDAWARLHARDLVGLLKGENLSLRAIHDAVGVSTPYLSQLANGTGPVPSEKILERLQRGARIQGVANKLPDDRPSNPSAWIGDMVERGRVARQQLARLGENRPSPVVHIEGLPDRQQHILRPIFENLAQLATDGDGASATTALLQELVEADERLHELLLAVAKDEDLRGIVSELVYVDTHGRAGLRAFLESRLVPVASTDRPDDRPTKHPIDKE